MPGGMGIGGLIFGIFVVTSFVNGPLGGIILSYEYDFMRYGFVT